jgi:hopene-associated glycosyltransferase HpnB
VTGAHWWSLVVWIPAAIWIFLLLGRGFFWRTSVRLPFCPSPSTWPAVSVVVPARDEASVLPRTLRRLLDQDYRGRTEVILVDDGSTDGTAEVAERTTVAGTRLDLRVITGTPHPPGWVGKTWAMQQGATAATAGSMDPEFVLFTDADIDHPPDSLSRLVAYALSTDRDLVSLMARLRVVTRWEKLIVPAFVYFFAQLYPFRLVASRRSRLAAAAGGCVLLRIQALARAGGLDAIAGAVIDDVALGRAVKRSGGSIWLGFTEEVKSVRPYNRLADLWQMVTRSAYTQLRCSLAALAGAVAGLAVVYLGPFVVLIAGAASGQSAAVLAGLVAWALMTVSYLPLVRFYQLSPAWALTLPLAAGTYMIMTIDSARQHRRGRGATWKGRTYEREVTG